MSDGTVVLRDDTEVTVTVHEPYDGGAAPTFVDECLALDSDEFASKTAKERDVILFTLVRDMAGEVRSLADKVEQAETNLKEMVSPEGLQALTERLMGGLGGGLLGGLLR